MITDNEAFAISDAALTAAIIARYNEQRSPIIVGLCGPQGSGKSTTAQRLAQRLEDHGKNAVILSLDDFYLTRDERAHLAAKVHPLLITRGVPGTHDLQLLTRILDSLVHVDGETIRVPIFDKLADDRRSETHWRLERDGADVVLLEGWCIGARPQSESELEAPVNDLEAEEDEGGQWRAHVNEQLATTYRALFDRLDVKFMLKAPGFECIHRWRLEQEQGLAAADKRHGMDTTAIERFVSHYERVTRWLLQDEPADLVVDLDNDRVPRSLRLMRPARPRTRYVPKVLIFAES